MATLASLAIDLTANSAQLVSEIKKVNKTLNGFEKRAKQTAAIIKYAFATVAGAAVVNLGKSAIDTADKIGKLSQRLGTTTEGLSQLGFVAERSGVEFNTLTMGLQRMTRRISEAAIGSGEAQGALKELGLSAQELNQLKPEEQFEAIAEEISKVASESERVRLAMKLFDSEGVALTQTMLDGADGIRSLREEADRLGATISQDAANSAAEFNDKMSNMQAIMNDIVKNSAIAFAEAFLDINGVFEDVNGEATKAEANFELIGSSIKVMAIAFTAVGGAIATIVELVASLGFAITELGKGEVSNAWTELVEGARRAEEQFVKSSQVINGVLKTMGGDDASNDNVFGTGKTIDEIEAELDKALELEKAAIQRGMEAHAQALQRKKEIEDEFAAEKLEKVEESLLTDSERLNMQAQNEINIIMDAYNRKLIGEAKFKQLIEKQEMKHLKAMKKLRSDDAKDDLSTEKELGRSLLSEGAKYSKAVFNANKALALAEGAIKAKEAVLGAYAAGSKIGGPPVGAAFAALAGVVAFGHLKSIADSSYSGGGGSSASGGGLPATPESEIEVSGVGDVAGGGLEPIKTVYINIEGIDDDALLNKNQLRRLIDDINEEAGSNARIVI